MPYTATVAATGGVGSYTFSSTGLPSGLSISVDGVISGTPARAGSFAVTVQATDLGDRTGARNYTLIIDPAPLMITTASPLSDVVMNAPIQPGVQFAAIGGTPPYTFSVTSGALPGGTTLASSGLFAGTPTQQGIYRFSVTAADSSGMTVAKPFVITVNAPLTITSDSPLPNGQVGVNYSAQISAMGGTGAYSWTVSGGPAGVAIASSSTPNTSLSGTPAAFGPFSVAVTVTDAGGHVASKVFSLTIAPAKLAITTAALPDARGCAVYAGPTLAASGGVPPYTWSAGGLPGGLTLDTASGAVGGTASAAGKFNVSVTVTDSQQATATQTLVLNVAAAPIVIAPSVPSGLAGSAYSGRLSASCGTEPYTWSASGLPANLTSSGDGTISGTPQAPGTASFTATVRDTTGATATGTVQITIGLPPGPPVNIGGVQDTSNAASQSRLQVGVGSTYPVDVTAIVTLTFTPDNGPDDPANQFSNGGRRAQITIPAGSTAGTADVGVQTGTVAGTITITVQLQAAGQDVTPRPAPSRTIRINAGPPALTAVTAARTSTGFTVTVVGYATSRELTQATFQFTGAAGSNLQTPTVTIPVDQAFAQWFASGDSAQYGGQFKFTQSFNIQGDTQAIASVSVTLASKAGASTPVTAQLQ